MGTRTVSVLSLLALSLHATAAFAAEPAVEQPFGHRDVESAIDLSDAYEPEAVYVTRVAAALKDGKVTGSFAVENTEDVLVTGLQYRLELLGVGEEEGLPYMVDVVRASVALAPSEQKTLLFSAPLPNVPAGRYDLRVQLLTAKGRSLGWMDSAIVVTDADAASRFVTLYPGTIGIDAFADKLLPPLSGPNVDPSTYLTLRGTAFNGGDAAIRVKPVVEIFDFNAARATVATLAFDALNVAPGESIPLSMPVRADAAPGVYMAHVTLRDAATDETLSTIAQYRYVVKGEDADVVALRIENMGTKAGDWAYGTIDIAGAADAVTTTTATLRVRLVDAEGELGSVEVPGIELTDAILTAKIRVPLERDLVGTPTAEASLLSDTNATYDHAVYAGTLTPAQLAGLTADKSVENWVAWHGMARLSLFLFVMALVGYALFSLVARVRGANGVAVARTSMAAFLLVCFATQVTSGFAAGSGGIEVLTPKNGSEVFAPLGNAPIVALFVNSPVHNQPNNFCNRQVTLSYRVDYGVCENQIANVRVLGRVTSGHLTAYDQNGAQWQTVHDKPFVSDLCTQHVCFASGTFNGTINLQNAVPANATEATLQLVAKYGKNIAMPDSSFDLGDQFIRVGWAHALNVHLQCEPQVGCVEILKETFDAQGNRITTPVPQFTFKLDGNQTAVNDSQGRAIFQNVAPGAHTVTEVAAPGWDNILVTPQNGTVQVQAGPTCSAVVFKNRQQPQFGCVEVLKEGFDAQGNRITTALPNFTFKLDNNQTVTSDAQGRATFQNVTPGSHTVTEAPLAGWENVLVTPQNGVVNVTAGQSCAAVVFKNKQVPQFGCVEILKEGFDAQGNRITTALPNFTFKLDNNQTVTSDAQGRATFQNVTAGSHTVTETPLAGWSMFNVTPANGVVNVAPGQACAAVVFKNKQEAQHADLQIQKTGPATAVRGQNLQYQFVVKNNGPASAPNVIVGDPLPAGTTFVAAQSDNRCSLQGNSVFCNLGTLNANQQVSLSITLKSAEMPNCTAGTLTNRASVLSDRQDLNLQNNESSFTTQMTCPAPQIGCIEVLKEGFDAGGSRLSTVPPFKFVLDGGATFVHSDNQGRAKFTNVPAGDHVVSEATASGWTLFNTTPAGGSVKVFAGNDCAAVVFKNKQNAVSAADLQIQKTGATSVVRGQNLQYQFVVKNNGPTAAPNVIVGDPLPAGTTFVAAQSDNRCTLQGNTVFCNLGTMAPNQQITLQMTVNVTASTGQCQTGTVVNNAAVLSDLQDPNTQNNQSSVTTQVTCPSPTGADVSVVKSGPASVQRGSNITYALTVANAGPASASGVVVSDAVPTGLTFVSAGSGCTLTNGTINCQLGTLASGQTRTLQFVFSTQAPTGTCAEGTVTNAAFATTASTDTNGQNNQSSATTALTCQPVQTGCVDVIKETYDTNNNVLTPVTQFTFTLDGNRTAVNDSQGRARFENVPVGTHTVTEATQANWTQISVTPQNGSVNVTAAGTCATVTFKNRQTLGSTASWSITKTDHETEVEPGDTLEYEIRVRNLSATRQTNVTVTDTLPEEVDFQDASPNETSENGRVIRWENQTFEPNEERVYRVEVDVEDDADGTLVNTAEVANITATDRTDVEDDDNDEDVEIELTKTASTSEVFPGGIIDYTVRVENTGDGTITDLTVTDNLPADVIIIDDGDADDRSGRRLEWEIDELDEGDDVTFRYRVSVPTYMVGGQTIRNQVCVESDDFDEECESVTVSVLGIVPTTGARGSQQTSSQHLKPIAKKEASPSDGTLPFLAMIALAGVGTGAGVGFGRRMLFGI